MAFLRNGVVIPNHDEYFDVEGEEDDELEEEDNYFVQPNTDNYQTEQSPSTFATAAVPTTVILALPNASASATAIDGSPEPKREPMEEKTSDSRKLFQRLWTEEDEITILQGFLDYNANRGSSYHNDTGSFYDQMKGKIQLDFTKSQLVDKLRRLKKKYRTVLQKFDSGKDFTFKSAHDQATFEISHKIWNSNDNSTRIGVPVEEDEEISPNPNPNPNPNSSHLNEKKAVQSRKRSRAAEEEKRELTDSKDNHQNNSGNNNSSNVDENGDKSNGNHVHNVPGLIEETVKSCLTPVLKELSNATIGSGAPFGFGGRGFGAGGFSMNAVPFGFLNLGSGEKAVDEKWRKQQILELEVYSKRLELVQDEIKVAIEELRSNAGAGAGGSGNNTNQ